MRCGVQPLLYSVYALWGAAITVQWVCVVGYSHYCTVCTAVWVQPLLYSVYALWGAAITLIALTNGLVSKVGSPTMDHLHIRPKEFHTHYVTCGGACAIDLNALHFVPMATDD